MTVVLPGICMSTFDGVLIQTEKLLLYPLFRITRDQFTRPAHNKSQATAVATLRIITNHTEVAHRSPR